MKYRTLKALISFSTSNSKGDTYRNYKQAQQGPDPQVISFFVTTPPYIEERSKAQRCRGTQGATKQDGEAITYALVQQAQAQSKQFDLECAFGHLMKAGPGSVLVGRRKEIQPALLRLANLLGHQAGVLAKNPPAAGSP